MDKSLVDAFWLVLCSALVFNMQLGFLCLESGLTRSKNAINVALKNLCDFALAVLLYWLLGFGLMFGASRSGWFGYSDFTLALGEGNAWLSAFFLFQAMFCATAATIISGASAERLRFGVYLGVGALVAGLIYPVFGHWAWAGSFAEGEGWLMAAGFVDFAGSTVVHSLGGWVALAVLLIIGPRHGRFSLTRATRAMPGSNLPLAMLGALLLFFGWFGFNGGSTLAADANVPAIVVKTLLGGVAGIAAVLLVSWRLKGYADAMQPMNGLLAGLVAVTASAHAISATDALAVGALGGLVMLFTDAMLLRWRIDDAVGAIPVHLGAGIWGTLAVALFGDAALLGTGLSFTQQFVVQVEGIVACAAWSFGLPFLLLNLFNRYCPMRVTPDAEQRGLNVAEHGARTELLELLESMEMHAKDSQLPREVPVEPFTEVGQIASQYNKVLQALRRATRRTHAIVRDIRDGIITFTAEGALTSFNPGAERLFGLPPNASGITLRTLLGDDGWRPQCVLPQPGGEVKREVLCRRWDGEGFLAELTVSQDISAEGDVYTGMIRDITERRRMEEQLFNEKTLAQVTLASIGDGVITTDRAAQVKYLNPIAEQLTGWTNADAQGRPLIEVYELFDEVTSAPLPNPVIHLLRRPTQPVTNTSDHTRMLRQRGGADVPIQDAAAPIRNAEGGLIGTVLTFRDVTVTRQLARDLSHQAAHDALTGLINRAEFEQRLQALLNTPADSRGDHVLCYLDLDQFKVVNDTCGHFAGDELLRQLAALLKNRIRGSDVLARLGGDEFGVLMYKCTVEQALIVAENVRSLVEDFRFSWQDKTFAVGVSIGVVTIGSHSAGLAPVLSAADAACYAAKDGGRNQVRVYEPDDRLLLERHGEMQWANRIRRALDEDRLRLFVQPIVPLAAPPEPSRPRYEVLVRMLDENDRLIPPGAFMPAAERYNVVSSIDRWVIANTLAWVGDYARHTQGNPGHYSVNIAAASLCEKDFLDFVMERIACEKVPPQCLCFEITETSAIANLTRAVAFMERLKAIGCSFALDDFGSGVSSFGYLKNLPVDYIKIDGVFVKDICSDRTARVMVASINNIGQEMGLQTVAEFVHSAEVFEELRAMGVSYAQGFYVSEPIPLDNLNEVRMMPR